MLIEWEDLNKKGRGWGSSAVTISLEDISGGNEASETTDIGIRWRKIFCLFELEYMNKRRMLKN